MNRDVAQWRKAKNNPSGFEIVILKYDFPAGEPEFQIGQYDPTRLISPWTDGNHGMLQTPDYWIDADAYITSMQKELIRLSADRDSEQRWANEYHRHAEEITKECARLTARVAELEERNKRIFDKGLEWRADYEKLTAENTRLWTAHESLLDALKEKEDEYIKLTAENAHLTEQLSAYENDLPLAQAVKELDELKTQIADEHIARDRDTKMALGLYEENKRLREALKLIAGQDYPNQDYNIRSIARAALESEGKL